MNKIEKLIKRVTIFAIMIFVVITISTKVNATQPTDLNPTKGNVQLQEVKTMGGNIVAIARAVGTVLSVAIIVILGIKYFFASIETRADYKKAFVPYAIGAVLLFSTTWISTIIYDISTSVIDTQSHETVEYRWNDNWHSQGR